jgi:hypothetical protein
LVRHSGNSEVINPSGHTIALGSTQPETEKSTRSILGVKVLSVRKVENFTAICWQIF